MEWAGTTWKSGWVAPSGQRIQKQIPWMSEQDMAWALEDLFDEAD